MDPVDLREEAALSEESIIALRAKFLTSLPIVVPPPVRDWSMSKSNTDKNKPKTTEIAFLLDRSGSMAEHTEAAIAGFNEWEKQGWEFLFLGANQDAIATAGQMNIHAHHAATASYSAEGVRGSNKAFSRKVQARRESISAEYGAVPSGDLSKPMDDILREENGE